MSFLPLLLAVFARATSYEVTPDACCSRRSSLRRDLGRTMGTADPGSHFEFRSARLLAAKTPVRYPASHAEREIPTILSNRESSGGLGRALDAARVAGVPRWRHSLRGAAARPRSHLTQRALLSPQNATRPWPHRAGGGRFHARAGIPTDRRRRGS